MFGKRNAQVTRSIEKTETLEAAMSGMRHSVVTLADGAMVAIPHGNLAAAKALLAAQKAAERRVAAGRKGCAAADVSRELLVLRGPTQTAAAPIAVGAQAEGHGVERMPLRIYDLEMTGMDEVHRVELPISLPCGLGACREPTRVALVEPNPQEPGLWTLLPVCGEAANHEGASDEHASDERQAERRLQGSRA